MKKGTSIALLSIISAIMAFVLVMTFIRFPVGSNKNYNSVLGAIELDHGMSQSAVYTLTLGSNEVPKDEEMDDLISTLSYRLSELGYENHSIKKVKNAQSNVYDIRLEINPQTNDNYEPDTETLNSVVDTAIKYGELEFFSGTAAGSATNELFADLENPIKSAKSVFNDISGAYSVEIKFTDEAYEEMQALMASGDFYLKVTFGEETLLEASTPLTESYFLDKALSFNSPSEESADQMVLQITSGGFAYKYNRSNVALVSPFLGENVALLSVIAIGALLVVAMAALIVLNKGFGIATSLGLLAFALLQACMLIAVPGIRLSMGGVIGVTLAAILAIDGMAIISKRVREELASGKTVRSAIRTGYKRSLWPILNAGIISVVISVLLFAFTSAEIKVFAIAFGIGSAIAVISSVVLSRLFITLLLPLVKNKEKFLNAKKEVE